MTYITRRPHSMSYRATVSTVNRVVLTCTAQTAGAGQIGAYTNVCFTIAGISEFTPSSSAQPAVGQVGTAQTVHEFKLEMNVSGRDLARAVVEAIKREHPYEEVVCDVYRLEDL
jgi:hypothetical protein